jgi:hypothetical protein
MLVGRAKPPDGCRRPVYPIMLYSCRRSRANLLAAVLRRKNGLPVGTC